MHLPFSVEFPARKVSAVTKEDVAMRESVSGDVLRVRAIAGTYVVVLAWDFVPGN